jgi:predicted dehydrogenase
MSNSKAGNRRDFLKRSAAVAAAAQLAVPRAVHAAGSDELKIALIGCGGRGTGAAVQALSTAGPVKLWAMADAFADRLEISLAALTKGQQGRYDTQAHEGFGQKVDVPPERRFVGLDAYKRAIQSGVDVVVDASPPGFRPAHFEYAVAQGKHVFMEKPVASDAPGVRQVLAAAEEAKRKNLKVGVGLQRHHQHAYLETIKRLRDGAIGKLMLLRCYWNTGYPGKSKPERLPDQTEMEYQLRNWYFFTWLSGDHICEQHIHNLDVANWAMGGHPVEANGMGGRQVRTGPDWGQIFDHHFVEFTYGDGTKMYSQCRQVPDCWNSVTEHAHGVEGACDISGSTIDKDGRTAWSLRAPRGKQEQQWGNPYQVEHDVLFDAVRNDKAHMEAEYGATSTMTAIMGRMATYGGKVVTWDEAFGSDVSLQPERLALDAPAPITPGEDGLYPVAIPGVTKAW